MGATPGVATSSDGVEWRRGSEAVAGRQGDSAEVGRVLGPNADNWWWHDTCHCSVSDVQVRSRLLAAVPHIRFVPLLRFGHDCQTQATKCHRVALRTPAVERQHRCPACDSACGVLARQFRPGHADFLGAEGPSGTQQHRLTMITSVLCKR